MPQGADGIEDFQEAHGPGASDSSEIFRRWKADRLLNESVAGGVILADLIEEDGLNDQVSEEVLDAFRNLTGGEVETYEEARNRIAEQIGSGESGASQQWISTIKGRVGENQFQQSADELPGDARLADESNQEAYDVVYTSPQGETRYVDVKTSDSSDYIVDEMESTQQQLDAGEVTTPDGEVVREVEYAVPEGTADKVQEEAASRGVDLGVIPMETGADEAAGTVEASVGAVGPEAIENLFQELAAGTAAMGAIHGMVQGFLVYKGSKQVNQAIVDAAEETALSGTGLSAGLVVESALREAALTGEPMTMALVFGTSVSVRAVLSDFVKRGEYASWMQRRNDRLDELMADVQAA